MAKRQHIISSKIKKTVFSLKHSPFTYRNPSPNLAFRLSWRHLFVIFTCMWLLLGDSLTQAANSYTVSNAAIGGSNQANTQSLSPAVPLTPFASPANNGITSSVGSAYSSSTQSAAVKTSPDSGSDPNNNNNAVPLNNLNVSAAPITTTQKQQINATQKQLARAYDSLPLSFEPNQGQTNANQVKFLAHTGGYNLYLTADASAVLDLKLASNSDQQACQPTKISAKNKGKTTNLPSRSNGPLCTVLGAATSISTSVSPLTTAVPNPKLAVSKVISGVVLRMSLAGANPSPTVRGQQQLAGKTNYLLGKDTSKWQTGLSTFGQVAYQDVYPGVDMVYYGHAGQLEYDLIVAANANPDVIHLKFDGSEEITLNSKGELLLRNGELTLKQPAPLLYQDFNGVRHLVEGGYTLLNTSPKTPEIGFVVGSYDHSRPLIIDPVLAYSTLLGGTDGWDGATAIAVDGSGNAYVMGGTGSTNFPTTVGAYQTSNTSGFFVSKLNATGNDLVYSTFVGGTASTSSYGNGMVVDASGNVYVAGQTTSADFPTTTGAYQTTFNNADEDGFVTKLNAAGNALTYSTFLGGANTNTNPHGISIDSSGNAYITGWVSGSNFPIKGSVFQPTPNGSLDAYIAKLNPIGSDLVYSSFLGGSGVDLGNAIAVDASGNAYVAGYTNSADFTHTVGVFQPSLAITNNFNVFVTKINSNASSVLYSTYLGGTSFTLPYAIAVDGSGNAYVTGSVYGGSSDFPTTSNAFLSNSPSANVAQAFVSKINPDATSLTYSSYLGGTSDDTQAFSLALDSSNYVYLTGATFANDYPTTTNAYQRTNAGNADVIVAKFDTTKNGNNSLVYSTYLGGGAISNPNGSRGSDWGYGIAVDTSGNAYVAGYSYSTDFPTTAGAYRTDFGTYQSNAKGFIFKLALSNVLSFTTQPVGIAAGSPLSVQPTITVQNLDGSTASNYNGPISVTLAGTTGATLAGTTTVTAVNGIATFTNLGVNTAGTNYVLIAMGGLLGPAYSAPFTITASSAAQVAATAGTPQSANTSSAFGTSLQATVRDAYSNPIAGISVTFAVQAAPGSAAAGTFTGGVSTTTATTNSSGVATAPTFTANGNAGGYSLIATVSGVNTPAVFALTNYGSLPPDPQTIAPPLDMSIATSVISATSFLYTGANPIQTGVTAGTITYTRIAVLRGKVFYSDGVTPLPGVTISVQNHPEYGTTLSRLDGAFDIAVNGGGTLVVNYQLSGYLPVQKQIDTPWQDYVAVPDVLMLGYDPQVTAVNLGSSGGSSFQVAQGSLVADANGPRQATLLFPASVTANMTLPNGTTQALPAGAVHVRATEYTLGANGPKMMPGVLPPYSGYTYAAEFSLDEAVSAGATNVSFSQPIIEYTPNFLSFAAGISVPVGYYDRKLSAWIADNNGLVIKVLSITNGKADLDIDGSGNPASATALSNPALAITDDERTILAALYQPGQGVWRVRLSHFSPWDYNWPVGPPAGATGPTGLSPFTTANVSGDDILDQSLHQTVGIAGTPYSLNYQSNRTPGAKSNTQLTIPLSGASVPTSLKRIDLQVRVGGRSYYQSFQRAANQVYTFTGWDGKDAYGRVLQGPQTAQVTITYVYDFVYLSPAQRQQVFNQASQSGVSISGSRSAGEVYLFTTQSAQIGNAVTMGAWDARGAGLGGWTLNIAHTYDPFAHVLYSGDGTVRSVLSVANQVNTTAGNGNLGNSGNGGQAIQASIQSTGAVAAAADGSTYFVDSVHHMVRKINPAGIISTFAGNGSGPPAGSIGPDETQATNATLASPKGLAIGPDGSVYISDPASKVVRRVTPNGIIHIAAGNVTTIPFPTAVPTRTPRPTQTPCVPGCGTSIQRLFYANGILATTADLNNPSGIAVGPDGSLYIADTFNNKVVRVTPDGIINAVAGNGNVGTANPADIDGQFATQVALGQPVDVAIGPDGNLYIVDSTATCIWRVTNDGVLHRFAGGGNTAQNPPAEGIAATNAHLTNPQSVKLDRAGNVYLTDNLRIRQINSSGIINTVAGNGVSGFNGDGNAATTAQFNAIYYATIGPDNTMYVSDGSRIRSVNSALPNYIVSDITIPSEDGSQLYQFDSTGRHLRTVNAYTNQLIYSFGYDSGRRLTSITDAYNNVTTILHDSNGKPTKIDAPFGQKTTLGVDSNGFLTPISDPSGYAYGFTYSAGGLMAVLTDPRHNNYIYTFDSSTGRLTDAKNPLPGNDTAYTRSSDPSGDYAVSITTDLGRNSSYAIHYLPTGQRQQTYTNPAGQQTVTLVDRDSSNYANTAPVGNDDNNNSTIYNLNTQTRLGPDPRYGMLAPVPVAQTVSTAPSGGRQLSSVTSSRGVTGQTFTSNVTVNNQTFQSSYNLGTSSIQTSSNAGPATTTTLDANSRPTLQQTANLASTATSYDAQGRISSQSRGTGNDQLTLTYYYGSDGYLDHTIQNYKTLVGSSTTPAAVSYRVDYSHTPQGWISYQSDPYPAGGTAGGGGVQYIYDEMGHLKESVNQKSQHAYKVYDGVGNLTSDTNNLGQTSTFGYDTGSRILRNTMVMTSGGPNLVTSYDYDTRDNLLHRTDANGIVTTYTYDVYNHLRSTDMPLQAANTSVHTAYSYNDAGQLATVTRFNTGGHNQITKYAYDTNNRLYSTQNVDSVTGNYYETRNGYDTAGNLLSVTQSKAFVTAQTNWSSPADVIITSYAYDSNNRKVSSTVNAWTSTGGSNLLTSSYSYDDPHNLQSVTEPYGIVTTMQNDPAGRSISLAVSPATSPTGQPNYTGYLNNTNVQNSYSFYDPNGLLLRSIDPLGHYTDSSYDPLHRVQSVTRYTGLATSGTALVSSTSYNDTVQPIVTTLSPNNVRHDTKSDEAGRVIATTSYPDANTTLTTSYAYDKNGNRTAVTDPNNHLTTFGYDTTGWLTSVNQTVTVPGSGLLNLSTTLGYDFLGNRTGMSDANGHATSGNSYDAWNRLIQEQDALGQHWDKAYDGLGRMTGMTDALGQITSYGYDNASRLMQAATSNGYNGAVNLTTSYTYNAGGKPLSMNDAPGSLSTNFTYDGFNRVTKVANPNGTVQYGYDGGSNRVVFGFGPSANASSPANTVSYSYDGLNRLQTLTNWNNQQLTYSYTGDQLNQIAYPNSVTAQYSYDGSNRLMGISHTKNSSTIFGVNYTLDNLGNRRVATESLSDGTSRVQTHTYDELSRLTSEQSQQAGQTVSTNSYQYDNVGNRLKSTLVIPGNPYVTAITNYHYNNADWLTSSDVSGSTINTAYNYDNNGNLRTETFTGATTADNYSIGYNYDARNRLASWNKAQGSTTNTAAFGYDGANNRLSMSYNTNSTTYLQDASAGLPVVVQETTGSNNSSYLYAPGSTSPLYLTDPTGTSMWYHSDGLGSVRALTGGTSGSVVNNYNFDAFGKTTNSPTASSNTHAFAGEQLDPTGLYFNRARYYNPSIGRFIGRDTTAGTPNDPLSMNRFIYGQDNPALNADPSGLRECESDGGACTGPIVHSNPSSGSSTWTTPTPPTQVASTPTPTSQQDMGQLAGAAQLGKALEEIEQVAAEAWKNWKPVEPVIPEPDIPLLPILGCVTDPWCYLAAAVGIAVGGISYGGAVAGVAAIIKGPPPGMQQPTPTPPTQNNALSDSTSGSATNSPLPAAVPVPLPVNGGGNNGGNNNRPAPPGNSDDNNPAYWGGWQVGEPINQLNKTTNQYPSWDVARARYWTTRGFNASSGDFSNQNLSLMRNRGMGPRASVVVRMRGTGELQQRVVTMELDHIEGRAINDPHNANNLQEVWPWEHEALTRPGVGRNLNWDFVRFGTLQP